MDNLVQAVVLAPLFVWMEALFMLGYRPELRKRLDVEVGREVRRFREMKEMKEKEKEKAMAT